MGQGAAASLPETGGDVIEHQRAGFQVAFGQRRLDGGLAFGQPVECAVEFILVDLAKVGDRPQAGAGGLG